MQYQLMFSLPLLTQFAFDFGPHTCMRSIKRYLEALATQVNFCKTILPKWIGLCRQLTKELPQLGNMLSRTNL